jgi:uncharacterized membrane protein YgaE (UPF0421/DUF939 family)
VSRAKVGARLRRILLAAVPLLQLTAAATIAWVIALQAGGHADPFFAPIAVVAALSSPLGERGSNAIRLVLGVMIGISVGELTVLVLGGGYGRLALATFTAMALARLLRGPRVVTVQAAAGAILTVANAGGEAGVHRLMDALIGAGVALMFSQVLLSPEPVALVRRAAADAMARIARSLALTAQALERDDSDLADEGLQLLRDTRDALTELARLRKASHRVARHSAIWRSRIEPVVRETENAGHLDLLSASCMMFARSVSEAGPAACAPLAPTITQLADSLAAMAADPADRATRQAAANAALEVARRLAADDAPSGAGHAAAVAAAQMITLDVMVVAGVDPGEAVAAVRQGSGDLEVPRPPRAPRIPTILERRPRHPH